MKTKPVLIGPHPQNESVILGGVASFQCKVKSVVQPHIQVRLVGTGVMEGGVRKERAKILVTISVSDNFET